MLRAVLALVMTFTLLGVVSDSPSAPVPLAALLPNGPALTLQDPLCPLNGTISASVSINAPAPPGGVLVTLGTLDPSIATIAPAAVTVPAGLTSVGGITVSGIGNGITTLTADATGCVQGTAAVTVTDQVISLGLNVATIPGQTVGLPVSLSVPAPAGGVTISFTSADPAIATVQASVVIPAGQQIPAANPQVTGVALGTTGITASAASFAPDTRDVTVAPNVIGFDPSPVTVAAGFTATIDVTLAVSAPAGGQLVNLLTDDPALATVPPSVTVPPGENSAPVVVTGVMTGQTTLRANATGIPEATATVNIVPPSFNLNPTIVGDDLQIARSLWLSAPAPAGNLDVTLTSADPSRLLLSADPTSAGAGVLVVTVPAGSLAAPSFWIQALDDAGTVIVSVSAPGWISTNTVFTLAPSGFRIWTPSQISAVAGGTDRPVQLRPCRLIPATLAPGPSQQVRGGLVVPVPVTTSNGAVGGISPNPTVFMGGEIARSADFTPIAVGTCSVDIGTPAGFDTPSSATSIGASVYAQAITLNGHAIGDDLMVSTGGLVEPQAPAGNLPVTLTSGDPSRLLLSTTPTALGAAAIVVTVSAGSQVLPTFWVHAIDDTGLVQVTATAAGYGPGVVDFELRPSGFGIWNPNSISVSSGTAPANVQIRPFRLDPATLATQASQRLRGGITASPGITSSDPSVGTITVSPLTFMGNDLALTTGFDPQGTGMCTVDVMQPAGFDTPLNRTSIPANVFDQAITMASRSVGQDLETTVSAFLSAPAPAGNLLVTITSAEPARLLVAPDSTTPGGASINLFVGAGQSAVPTFWVQAIDNTGTVDVIASAPGYANATAAMTLTPSGFAIFTPAMINTSTFAAPTNVQLRPYRLEPATLNRVGSQRLRPGVTVGVDVTSSNTNVGTITVSPVVFTGGDLQLFTAFDPLISGSTTIDVVTPAGFDTPSSGTSIAATVDAPDISFSGGQVGVDLQVGRSIFLGAVPPNPVDVTVTVNDPAIATISTDPLVAGTGSITFTGVTSTTVGTIHVQGRSLGSTTIVVQAAGYDDGMGIFDVDPCGFGIWTPSSIDTTIYSQPSNVQIRPYVLDPVTLNTGASQRVRGGATVSVTVSSMNAGVGVITLSPLVFNANELAHTTAFQPVAPGITTVDVTTPAGWATPSNRQSIAAQVRLPNITMQDVDVGEDLQVVRNAFLEAPPPIVWGVTFRVVDPSIALISDVRTARGRQNIDIAVSGAAVGPVYVQGISQGTTTIEVTANDYVMETATVTVGPSGFAIFTPTTISTSTLSAPTNIQVRPFRLNPVTLNVAGSQETRGGFRVAVPITIGNAAVARLNPTRLRFDSATLIELTQLIPQSGGTTAFSVGVPVGFDPPSNNTSIPVTVTAPTITFPDATVGEDLQQQVNVFLQAAPNAPTTFTVTVANPAVAAVSTSATAAGAGAVAIPGVTSTSAGPVFVQGLAVGTTTITVSAPGYTPRVANVTVDPSGFRIFTPSAINTTASSGATNVQIRPCRLHPVTLNTSVTQALRGGFSANVVVTSSDLAVGTITTSPLTFTGGALFLNTGFLPVGPGSATVSLTTPPGFDPPSNNTQITATVNP